MKLYEIQTANQGKNKAGYPVGAARFYSCGTNYSIRFAGNEYPASSIELFLHPVLAQPGNIKIRTQEVSRYRT